MTIRAIFPGRILANISILPIISRIWLCLPVQTDLCMTSVPYTFETLSRYFESKQYRNLDRTHLGKMAHIVVMMCDLTLLNRLYHQITHRVHAHWFISLLKLNIPGILNWRQQKCFCMLFIFIQFNIVNLIYIYITQRVPFFCRYKHDKTFNNHFLQVQSNKWLTF